MSIKHISGTRNATPREIDRDSLSMGAIKDMFPYSAMLQKMSPHGLCESIPSWTPILDQAISICVTEKGADTFRRVAMRLAAIKESGPSETTIADVDAAFFRLTETSLELCEDARSLAAAWHS